MANAEMALVDSFLDETGQRAHLVQVRHWLETQGLLADAFDYADKAAAVTKWVRVSKQANALAVEAMKIEAVALRIIGLAGEAVQLDRYRARTARLLSEMDDNEFASLLAGMPDGLTCALSTWVSRAGEEGRARQQRADAASRYREAERGKPRRPAAPQHGLMPHASVAEAARELLVGLLAEGECSTDDVAHRLLRQLGADAEDEAALHGCRFLVRNAVRRANSTTRATGHGGGVAGSYEWGGEKVTLPAIVTYFDAGVVDGSREGNGRGSFVRVDVVDASLCQLEQMAKYRAQQAAEMAVAAEALGRMVELLRTEEAPDANEPGSVWARFQKAWLALDLVANKVS